MAPSEWTRCIRAVRDTPVADHSAPSLNTPCRVAYHSPIAVSPVVPALSVFYFKRTLWRWVQLWPYVGMGSLVILMDVDCNAMGDVANISPRIPSSCVQNAILSLLIIPIIPCRQIYVTVDNPSLVPSVSWLPTSSYSWNYVCASDDVCHSDNFQCNGCQCFSHLYKFWDGIQVTWVFRHCGVHQG